MKTFVYQTQERGCGFASVKMALIQVSGDRRYAYVAEPFDEPTPDLEAILSYARKLGLYLRAFKTPDPGELLEAAGFPLILVLRRGEARHTVFVPRRRGKRFLVLDPELGPSYRKGEDLVASFTGIYLRIENYEEGGFDLGPAQPGETQKVSFAALAVMALLPMAFLMLGFVFLDFSFPPWSILACFGATIAASVLQRWATLTAMRRFDGRYLSGIDDPLPRQRRQRYVHYHAYKRAVFVSRGEVLGRFATVAAAFLFFLHHDLFLAAACAIGLALTVLGILLMLPRMREMERKAEEEESRLFRGALDPATRAKTLTAISSRADRYGRILGLKEGALLLLGLGLSSFACYANTSAGLRDFLFDFASIEFFLFEAERIFALGQVLSKKKREETYFRVHILPRALELGAGR